VTAHGALPKVPSTVANLDPDLVASTLALHGCNVTDAARDLDVPASHLRRLLWAQPALQDQAFEVVEARLDAAERNIHEALASGDIRMRVAASMFTLRNTAKAKRRGWIVSASAGVEVNVNAQSDIVYSWRSSPGEKSPEDLDAKSARLDEARAAGKTIVTIGWEDPGDAGDDRKTIEREPAVL
jgi:hypothetical protein